MNVPKLRFKEFNDEWVNTNIKSISNYIDGNYGENYPKESEFIRNGIPFITSAVIGTTGIFDRKLVKYISQEKNSILIKAQSTGGDIVLTNRGASMGVTSIIPEDYEIINIGPQLTRIRCFQDKAVSSFVLQLLKSPQYLYNLKLMNAGSAMPFISLDGLGKFKISLPTIKEQKKIGELFKLLDKKIELQSRKIEDFKLFKLSIKNNIFKKLENSNKLYIEDILDFEQPTKYIVNSEEYTNNKTDIPVLTANKAFILGYCKEDNFYNKKCIIFDDFTLDMKYVDFPFKVKSSAIKILTPKEDFNLKYIFEYMKYLDLHSEEHKRHYISIVQKIKIPVPEIKKQISIANKLECFDNKIGFEVNKLEKLIELKKGLMQSMFV